MSLRPASWHVGFLIMHVPSGCGLVTSMDVDPSEVTQHVLNPLPVMG